MTQTDVWTDPDGVERYKEKPLMRWLCDRIGLNDIWLAFRRGDFSRDELKQFYRDIGYSLAGFDEVWDWRDEEENLKQEVIKDMEEEKPGHTYTILCPRHLVEEEITLPNCYSINFEGTVPCGAETGCEDIYICVSFDSVCGIRKNTPGSQVG